MTADEAVRLDEAGGVSTAWQVAPGLELLGEVRGSGLKDPSFLLRRADGQVVQVSELLYLVVNQLAAGDSPGSVRQAVSDACGRTLTADGLSYLLENRLSPLGLVLPADGSLQDPPRARPLLSLTFRGTLLPRTAVRALARGLTPLFWPPVVVLALASAALLDVFLVRQADLAGAVTDVLTTPALLLGLYTVLVVAALVHETGHAAACSYGGAKPGVIGYGVYLVFPAFFTDVTDSYRLSRAGRIRTDLGGLYFNVWCLLGLGGAYLGTGNGVFLLALVVMHLEMLQQLIPVVRFDGYFVLADLAGVPDLFARVKPVLRTLVSRRTDPRVAALRPAARRVVVGWVLVVVPTLAVATGWLLWQLPLVLQQTTASLRVQLTELERASTQPDFVRAALSIIDMALLLLPLAGLAVVLFRLATAALRASHRSLMRGTQPEEAAMPTNLPSGPLSAAAFTDEGLLPSRKPVPALGWRRTLYRSSGGRLNLGPGPAERHRADLERRLRTPIQGTRRVVVMSRKGGVGKTTITLALGSAFATIRGDRVVAVDANPDAGNLAHRVAPPNGRTVTDVLADIDKIDSYAELRSYVSQASQSRLEVLASDDDPRIGMALDRTDYHRLICLLDHYYNLIVLDTGTGILDSANQGLLAEADELVLVLRAGVDGGRAAALTLDWLEEHNHEGLVERAIVVVNGVRPGIGAPVRRITEHFERRCSRVVTVPWDPALESGGQTLLRDLQPQTQDSLIALAAAVADNFPTGAARR